MKFNCLFCLKQCRNSVPEALVSATGKTTNLASFELLGSHGWHLHEITSLWPSFAWKKLEENCGKPKIRAHKRMLGLMTSRNGPVKERTASSENYDAEDIKLSQGKYGNIKFIFRVHILWCNFLNIILICKKIQNTTICCIDVTILRCRTIMSAI